MKRKTTLIFICIFLIATKINAQNIELWGTTYSGGSTYNGTIFKINEDATGFNILYNFSPIVFGTGRAPLGNLAKANNDKLYGVTFYGGISDSCVLFSFDPATNIYTSVHDFDHPTGYIPVEGLVNAPNGKLYGVTIDGGNANVGVLYSFDPASNTYSVLHHFNSLEGNRPRSIPFWINNKLYGTTTIGGTNNGGTIYSFDVLANTFSDLYNFNSATGSVPWGDLIQASDSKLYGIASYGGANNYGAIFSFDVVTNTYVDIYDVNLQYGFAVNSGLMQANNGKLYGMTFQGGSQDRGIIFSYDIASDAFTNLHDFDSINGQHPRNNNNFIEGNNGKLYGMTHDGGAYNQGIIFNVDLSDNAFTNMFDFNLANGSNPEGSFTALSSPTIVPTYTSNKELSVYPNPVTNQLAIGNGQYAISTIEIFDMLGEKVLSQQQTTNNKPQTTIDVSEINPGIYFITVTDDVGNKVVRKIVKM